VFNKKGRLENKITPLPIIQTKRELLSIFYPYLTPTILTEQRNWLFGKQIDY
jgi:hypothetical protein